MNPLFTHSNFSPKLPLLPLPNTDYLYYLEGKIYPHTTKQIKNIIDTVISHLAHYKVKTQSLDPSIPQSFNPSILQSFNPSILQSLDPSILQSLNPSILQSLNLSIPQSLNPSILQSLNPSILQSLNPSHVSGSYLLYFQATTSSDWYLLNDPFGRLPCYYYIHPQTGDYIFSRDIQEVLKVVENVRFNQQALSELLLLGYPLGDKTLYKDIYYLPPATIVAYRSGQLESYCYHQWNFEELANKEQRYNVKELVDLFMEGVRVRSVEKQVVALSGGLDSRAVVGALHRLGITFQTATCIDAKNAASKDVKAAREMANLLVVAWEGVEVPPASMEDIKQLLQLKAGHNYLGMAYFLPFLRQLRAKGYQQYWTGDGGDKVLPDISPMRAVKNAAQTLSYLLDRQGLMPIQQVAQLTGLASATIKEAILQQLVDYPEEEWSYKYVHFQLMERSRKWIGEGEDRNRSFIWSVSPFYHLPFFEAAMQFPIAAKKDFQLYRQFLEALHPTLANYPNANWGFPIGETKQLKQLLRRQKLGTYIPRSWKNKIKKYNALQADQTGKWRAIFQQASDSHQTLALEHLWDMSQLKEENLWYVWMVVLLEETGVRFEESEEEF